MIKNFCSKCGKEIINKDSQFCIFCGNQLSGAKKQEEDEIPLKPNGEPDYGAIGLAAAEKVIAEQKRIRDLNLRDEIMVKAYTDSLKKQRQAGIFGAVMSVLFIITGFITLQPGMGIYFLIAGLMTLCFTVFMFVLANGSKKSLAKEIAKKPP